ncbi:carbonic anhydrase [Acidiferrobacter sp.]|uniref:carbonic anhydrase n=1 Tax=Acidiferrobacter sp. TaxID=1872107 RepID=UPI00262340D5|nr:carbonic anhydrase [Acidiferrobacter sp.]
MRNLSWLVEGFGRFRQRHFESDLFKRLSEEGQTPKVLVLGCCDSRVDPAIVLDCDPGDLFVIRNVANLVPPFESAGHYHGTSAALEFGVCNLDVEHVIVLGHAQCGGIRALLEGTSGEENSFIKSWMTLAESARDKVLSRPSGESQAKDCEKQAILASLENLMTFPWVRSRVEAGELQLHGWYFDIENGTLLANKNGVFAPLSSAGPG